MTVHASHPKPTREQKLDRVSYAFPLTFACITYIALLAFSITAAADAQMSEHMSIRVLGIAFAAICGGSWVVWVFSHFFCYSRDTRRLHTDVPFGFHLVFCAQAFSGLFILFFSAALIRWFLFFDRDKLETIDQMVHHLQATVALFTTETAMASFSPFIAFLSMSCVYGGYYSIWSHVDLHKHATTQKRA